MTAGFTTPATCRLERTVIYTKRTEIQTYAITIKDEKSGEEYTITTVRPAKWISEYLDEMRKELVESVISEAVYHMLDEE